ncbi:class F sortase [Actinomadura sp. WMMB 499]|uniref:class F sortase n=1 Tax=Actinomadura sp. WMMB 499 TaxID=1219491 RepID=UPI001C3F6ED7|nr:class F sortase [Actinomadura sp. WMMB 499]
MTPRPGRAAGPRTRLAALAAAALAACTGVDLLAPAEPPRTPRPPPSGPAAPSPSGPARLTIASIGVDTDLLRLGLAPDGTLAVPRPPHEDRAAWYTGSAPPGEPGTAVITGHRDSRRGPSIFFRLDALRPGASVRITRADGTAAIFAVDTVRRHRKADFPARTVYRHTPVPSLRLITCGGPFDDGRYRDNIVAYARLTAAA